MNKTGLNIKKVLAEFQKAESSITHRKGTFKIDAPFEKALDTILKSKSGIPQKKRRA